jgi:hypothetical protein
MPCCSTHEQGGLCGGVTGVMVVLLGVMVVFVGPL